MKQFRTFFAESKDTIPAIVLGIHKWVHDVTPRELGHLLAEGSFYDLAKPMSSWTPDDSTDEDSHHDLRDVTEEKHQEIKNHFKDQIVSDNYLEHRDKHVNNALWRYGDGSGDLNRRLIAVHKLQLDPHDIEAHKAAYKYRSKHVSGGQWETDPVETHQRTIDLHSLIKNVKPFHEDFHVYSGVGHQLNIHDLRSAGHNTMVLPAFTSTSFRPSVARLFANNLEWSDEHGDRVPVKPFREIVRIRIPANKKTGIDMYHHSPFPDEDEYLLNHGTRLKFVDEPRIIHSAGSRSYPDAKYKPFMIHSAEIIT